MPVMLPVKKLQAICDPFFGDPWGLGKRLTIKEVEKAIRKNDLESNPEWLFKDEPKIRGFHIRRVAYLVLNPAPDPIELDIGVPSLGCHVDWPIVDGNHRFASAIVRGDEFVSASVSGSLQYAFELFGVDCKEDWSK